MPIKQLLSLSTLRKANTKRQKEWDPGDKITIEFRGNEMAGEVGEACNVIKKLARERMEIQGPRDTVEHLAEERDTVEHLAEELADVIICADLIAMQMGIDLASAVAAKFNGTSEKNKLTTFIGAGDVVC
jgi:NTP pyrophosphatase (non-canonical NTP hydrolase)